VEWQYPAVDLQGGDTAEEVGECGKMGRWGGEMKFHSSVGCAREQDERMRQRRPLCCKFATGGHTAAKLVA
jgi:hypothetical protein